MHFLLLQGVGSELCQESFEAGSRLSLPLCHYGADNVKCLCHLLGEILISPANFFFRRRKSFFASGIFFADKKYFRQRKKFCRRKKNFAGENRFSPAKKNFAGEIRISPAKKKIAYLKVHGFFYIIMDTSQTKLNQD